MIKRINVLSLLLAFFAFTTATFAVNSPVVKSDLEEYSTTDISSPDFSLDQFLALSASDVTKVTGKKMKIKDRVALFVAKKEIKKQRKAGISDADIMDFFKKKKKSKFDWVGFLLGFFLGLLGVLIVYLAMEENQRRSAWIGFGVSAGIYVIILIAYIILVLSLV